MTRKARICKKIAARYTQGVYRLKIEEHISCFTHYEAPPFTNRTQVPPLTVHLLRFVLFIVVLYSQFFVLARFAFFIVHHWLSVLHVVRFYDNARGMNLHKPALHAACFFGAGETMILGCRLAFIDCNLNLFPNMIFFLDTDGTNR